MKRIDLLSNVGNEYVAGSSVQLEDERAEKYIKTGKAKLSPLQVVYSHQDEMSPADQERAAELLAIADAAGGYRDVVARQNALAPHRAKK